jgi:hypothetical protein
MIILGQDWLCLDWIEHHDGRQNACFGGIEYSDERQNTSAIVESILSAVGVLASAA